MYIYTIYYLEGSQRQVIRVRLPKCLSQYVQYVVVCTFAVHESRLPPVLVLLSMSSQSLFGSIAATPDHALTMLINLAKIDLHDMTHHQMELEMLTLDKREQRRWAKCSLTSPFHFLL